MIDVGCRNVDVPYAFGSRFAGITGRVRRSLLRLVKTVILSIFLPHIALMLLGVEKSTQVSKSIRVYGTETLVDDQLLKRINRRQHFAVVIASVLLVITVYHNVNGNPLNLFSYIIPFLNVLFFISLAFVFYKNVSRPVVCRLLKEVNVLVILAAALLNFIINCTVPHNEYSWISGLSYLLITCFFVLMDALIVKTRRYEIVVTTLFLVGTLASVFERYFLSTDEGVVLLQYNNHILYKRAVKRSLFMQIACFSLSGVITIWKDKKQEKMIFATDNVYRETGTTLKFTSSSSGAGSSTQL